MGDTQAHACMARVQAGGLDGGLDGLVGRWVGGWVGGLGWLWVVMGELVVGGWVSGWVGCG